MIGPPFPPDEDTRQAALEDYEILDTGSDDAFDRITRFASNLLGCPISVISLVDNDRQWFKSHLGLDATETSRSVSFCGHTILTDGVLVVDAATKDERFHDNPLVTGDPRIRFYAGAPLITSLGHRIGSICTIDTKPRVLTNNEQQILRDLSAMVMNEIELRRLASVDALTHAFNRRFFLELADRELGRAERHQSPLSILAIDIDHFKSFNDKYGHHVGDLGLTHLVKQCRNVLRAHDLVGRLGGEEFAFLLPHADCQAAKLVADKLRSALSAHPLSVGALALPMTVSIGIAEYRPGTDNLEMLLERADQALYAAKNGGRNQPKLAA